MTSEENPSRNFKGIWIPREIWLHPELNCFEKILWAEIDSLDNPETGCVASNQYLQRLLNVKERFLQLALAKLKKLGLIRYESFDGRQRVLRSCLKTTYEKFDTTGVKNSTPLPYQTVHPYNKEYNKAKSPPPPSSKEKDPWTKLREHFEEEEISFLKKRFEERPQNLPPVKNLLAWAKKVIAERQTSPPDMESIAKKHKKQAKAADMTHWNGYRVMASEEYVEFTDGPHHKLVKYAISDEEWKCKTGWSTE